MEEIYNMTTFGSFNPEPDQLGVEKIHPASLVELNPWNSSNPMPQTAITIPYESPIFRHIQEGDIRRSMELIDSGLVSVHSVDPYGLGVLYVSYYHRIIKAEGHVLTFAITVCHILLFASLWSQNIIRDVCISHEGRRKP